jgi:hypothetical protein
MAINPIKVWNGTAWEYTGPVVAAPPVKYQATAPTSPATGDVWVESDYDVASVDPSKLLTGGVYTNESTRSAAIPTPTTGMVTYVGDTGTESPSSTIPQLEAYTGSAWQNLSGMTLLGNFNWNNTATFTVDNVFTTAYDEYKIIISQSAGAGYSGLTVNPRSGGADITTNITSQLIYTSGTSLVAAAYSGAWRIGDFAATANGMTLNEMRLFNPMNSTYHTTFISDTSFPDNTVPSTSRTMCAGGWRVTNAMEGIKFIATSNQTARVTIYGMRKS